MKQQVKELRTNFTYGWANLSQSFKSVIISVGAFITSILMLNLFKYALPSYDYSMIEVALATAFSGFLVSFIKDTIKI